RRVKPLTLLGGRGFADFYARLKGAYGDWIDPGAGRLAIREVAVDGPDRVYLAGIEIRSSPTVHTPQSVAFRLTSPAGRSLVYSGDTDWAESLIQLAERADLLVCEAAFPEGQKVAGHLTPALAGRIAARAQVRRLMLTHFYPACEAADIAAQCRQQWPGPLILARDLMRISLE
ncbi:MAG: MBL fold metallo-hydrolase, partial [Desulfobacterales bacterium]